MFCFKACDGCLISKRIIILIFLRVFRKRELEFGLVMVFASHVDDEKEGSKRVVKSALYLTTSYGYEWTDRPWWANTRDGPLAAWNGSFHECQIGFPAHVYNSDG